MSCFVARGGRLRRTEARYRVNTVGGQCEGKPGCHAMSLSNELPCYVAALPSCARPGRFLRRSGLLPHDRGTLYDARSHGRSAPFGHRMQGGSCAESVQAPWAPARWVWTRKPRVPRGKHPVPETSLVATMASESSLSSQWGASCPHKMGYKGSLHITLNLEILEHILEH